MQDPNDKTDWLDVNNRPGDVFLLIGIRKPRTVCDLIHCIIDALWH